MSREPQASKAKAAYDSDADATWLFRRAGQKYYAHLSNRSQAPLWHDDALPAGWAFGKDSETGPRYWVNLLTEERHSAPPAPARQITGDDASCLAAGSKRLRPEAPSITAPEALVDQRGSSQSRSDKAPVSALPEFGAAPGVPPARFPGHVSDANIGMCRTEPFAVPLPRLVDGRFFEAPHRLILSQLTTFLKSNALAHERKMQSTEQRRDFRAPVHVLDLGAGELALVRTMDEATFVCTSKEAQ